MRPKIDTGAAPLASVGIHRHRHRQRGLPLGQPRCGREDRFRWKVKRFAIRDAFEKLPSCIVGMGQKLTFAIAMAGLRSAPLEKCVL